MFNFLEIGRTAINNANGLSLLHKFCQHCPDDVNHDPLLVKTCTIINACTEKKEMPILNPKSPAQFPLPVVTEVTNSMLFVVFLICVRIHPSPIYEGSWDS